MKILWIVNSIFPAPGRLLGMKEPVRGGWMFSMGEQIGASEGTQLAVATIYSGREFKEMTIDGIVYFFVPFKNLIKYDTALEQHWENICNQFKPDLVHIHGTEYTHGLACMRKLPHLNYVISIQGLISVYARYYLAGIPFWDILKNITFRDIIKWDNLFQLQWDFKKRGVFEKEYLQRAKHVIGRTKWDYVHVEAVNPQLTYHFCNETLRENFYTASKWSLQNCEPYTIFLSQAIYPIKGLHQVIEALAFLKHDYPRVMIRIGGFNITRNETIKDKIRRTGYGKYLAGLLAQYKLEKHILFLEELSEKQMIAEYQRAHVFICPSSIENSPNSLGEAQLLGTPCIAAFVGGVPDMVVQDTTGILYRFEEVEMLAQGIRRIFDDPVFASRLSRNAIPVAEARHHSATNAKKMHQIYQQIIAL